MIAANQTKQSDTHEIHTTVPLSFLDNKTSLRDQFAMAALTGLISRDENPYDPGYPDAVGLAGWSYVIADEMIKQRKEEN